MRRQNRYNFLLHSLGLVTKGLFVAMFVFSVICVLAAALGASGMAWSLYSFIWPFFWKLCFTLICLLAVAIALEGLQ